MYCLHARMYAQLSRAAEVCGQFTIYLNSCPKKLKTLNACRRKELPFIEGISPGQATGWASKGRPGPQG